MVLVELIGYDKRGSLRFYIESKLRGRSSNNSRVVSNSKSAPPALKVFLIVNCYQNFVIIVIYRSRLIGRVAVEGDVL